MAIRESLIRKLGEFLAERKSSDDGAYAPVTDQDVQDLYDIIHGIIESKWRKDCDGDLPVNCKLVNRNTHQSFHYHPLKYLHEVKTYEDFRDLFRDAECNLSTATREMSLVMDTFSMMDEKQMEVFVESMKTLKAKLEAKER